MASGSTESGSDSVCLGSEDLTAVKCEPCHEDGNIREAVGMCVDCQDYLCEKCFDGHTLPRPCRNHKLLDKQQMLQSQIQMTPKDRCTERCTKHDREIIKYYCTGHCKLACSICLNLDHRTCDAVKYIPDVAKDLENNEEYKQAETLIKSALETMRKVCDDGQYITQQLEKSCEEAVERLEKFRLRLNEALDTVKKELLEKAEVIKFNEIEKIEPITDKYHGTLEELETMLKDLETLESTSQYCDSYTLVMKTNEKLWSSNQQEMKADAEQLWQTSKIKFTPNQEILDKLKNPESVGKMTPVETVIHAEHDSAINVKTRTDKRDCWITGSVILPDNTLVVVDRANTSIKAVDVKQGKVTAVKKLPADPWDITTINDNQVAITIPQRNKVAFITAAERTISVDRILDVQRYCYGIHYSNGKLAVSFQNPDGVQVLNLQGIMLYNITTDKEGQAALKKPKYVSFGQDDTSLYVSNWHDHNSVVHVKLDGTVLGTYTDDKWEGPMKTVFDDRGSILVPAFTNTIHQITPDCRKIRELLSKVTGLRGTYSISYSEAESQLYLGGSGNNINVYRVY